MALSRLYLKNLPAYLKSDDLRHYLEGFGRVTELKIVEDYGFAEFASSQDAKNVLDTFRDRLFLGHRTVIEFARPLRSGARSTETRSSRRSDINTDCSPVRFRHEVRPKRRDSRQCRYPVHVDKIPRHICWQQLKDFGRLAGGLVAYCDLDRTRTGHGFIEYLSRHDAEEAVRRLDGERLGGVAVRVWSHSGTHRRHSRSQSFRTLLESNDERHGRCELPVSASRYSLQSSTDTALSHRFQDHAIPAVLPSELPSCSNPVDHYHTGFFERSEEASTLILRTPCLNPYAAPIESTEPTPRPDYYDFDQYLRLSYDHRHYPNYY